MNVNFKKTVMVMQSALIVLILLSFAQAQSGAVDATFNPGLVYERTTYPYTNVEQMYMLPDGKVLIGGYFSAVGKVGTYGIARLNADGTVDTTFHAPLITQTSGSFNVSAIAVQPDGKVLIGGFFASVAGNPRPSVARLNADGSLDTSFNVSLSPTNFLKVLDIKVTADNKIILVGTFSFNSGASKNIVRLNNDGTIDNTFNASSVVNLLTYVNRAEILPSGKILIAGTTPPSSFIYRLNPDGSIDSTFTAISFGVEGTSSSISVNAIEPTSDGKFYVGGDYDGVNGFALRNLARFNADGSVDTSFNSGNAGPNDTVVRIEILSSGQLIIGGAFSTFNGISRKNVVKINPDGSLDDSINFSGRMMTKDFAILANGEILLGGEAFDSSTSNYRPALLKLNADGSVATAQTLVGEYGFSCKTYVQSDGKILVGGLFTHADNQRRQNLIRLNADGTLDTTFTPPSVPLVLGLDVRADGKILVSTGSSNYRLNTNGSLDVSMNAGGNSYDGKFLAGGGAILSTNSHLRKYSESGVFDSSFDVTANSTIRKILMQPDGKFIVAGDFTQIAGQTRGRIARINADGTLDTTFSPPGGASNSIFDAVLQPDGKIVVGGNFPGINFNTNYKYLARLNSDGTLDTGFNPIVEGGVQSLKIQPDGKILIGGGIYLVNGAARGGIARLNSNGSLDTTFNAGAGANNSVLSIDLQADGNIIMGGTFTRVDNLDRLGVARLFNTLTAARTRFDFDGDGKADLSVFRSSNGAWYLNQSQSGFVGYVFGAAGDQITPADYDGDGKTDLAVFRAGTWYIQRSTLGFSGTAFGAADDVPVPADYDGDGKADLAVFRPSNGTWYRINSSNNQFVGVVFGQAGDKPIIGDFDGDGQFDIAVFRPSNGTWYIQRSQLGFTGIAFGAATDSIVPADYDGDGKTDIAVFRPSNGTWYLQRSSLGFTGVVFGDATDKPAPADYDGDGKADVAVFRPSTGVWYLLRSTQGFAGTVFGSAEDNPIPNAFVR